MSEPPTWRWMVKDPHTSYRGVEVVAAADFDRLRDERDRAIAQREQAAGTRNVIAAERDLAIDRLDAVSRERDEAQDAWERDNREKHEWIENVRQMRTERDEARRVAGVLADAHRRIADLPIVDDSDADRMREIAVAALAAADREENTDA